jgi:hypothetical protein
MMSVGVVVVVDDEPEDICCRREYGMFVQPTTRGLSVTEDRIVRGEE